MLFYVADGLANDGRLHIQRVWYVAAGKGVLIHRTNSSSGYANLLRTDYSFEDLINQKIPQAITDKTPYENNMLKGVTTATTIAATVGLHLWKKNSMLSIFGGTILFMFLSRIF